MNVVKLLCSLIVLMSNSYDGPKKDIVRKAFNVYAKVTLKHQYTLINCSKQSPLHEVPVLCYHQIRDWKKTDSKNARSYIMPPDQFKRQFKMMVDSGYHFILPAELVSYVTTKSKLPQKPVILTFDDATLSEFTEALPKLNKDKIKAVFFVMTVVLNHPNYMSFQQVRTLADQGHIIGCHTWDHHAVTSYKEEDWKIQVEYPKNQLEKITGKPVEYFAYPYGAWNAQAIRVLKNNNFLGAFQLTGKQDKEDPLFTIRRIIVDSYWNEKQLLNAIKYSFK